MFPRRPSRLLLFLCNSTRLFVQMNQNTTKFANFGSCSPPSSEQPFNHVSHRLVGGAYNSGRTTTQQPCGVWKHDQRQFPLK